MYRFFNFHIMKKKSTKISVLKFGIIAVLIFTAIFGASSVFLFPKVSVDVKEVEIKSPSSDSTVKIGSSQKSVIQALGNPKQVTAFSSQTSYKQGTVLNYSGAKFYFVHNKLSNFEITSHKFKVGIVSAHKFNSIGNSKDQLPHFKIDKNTALLDVKNDDFTTDQYLEYDLSDSGKVTKITYSDY